MNISVNLYMHRHAKASLFRVTKSSIIFEDPMNLLPWTREFIKKEEKEEEETEAQ